MPLALETVVKQLEDSGIVSSGKLESFIPPKASPKDAEELLRELHKQKLLTKFQAQQVAAGKAKALILGAYTILDKIGAGGMGQVFKAEHRRMKRVVAIKMLPAAMLKDAAAAARFQREVEAAAKLEHANIVTAYDADEANGVHFLVMQYVEGSDLSALVKKSGPFSVEKAVDYLLQAARGLEFAHRNGVIHRDIKPANLLLDKHGTVKILDMGLARIESGGNAATQAELTGTGAVMGTVDYMAPEQARSTHHADARADIYSLGCSLYYLLTAKPLYGGETITNKLISHQFDPIPSLRVLRDDVPEEVESIYRGMVAKKVEDRYQSMSEVIADLQLLVSGGSTTIINSMTGSTNAASSNSNLTFLKEAAAGQTIQHKATKKIKQLKAESGGVFKTKKLTLIGAAIIGILILAGITVSLRTKEGTLVVEIDQPDAMVQVLDAEGKVEVREKGGVGKVTISLDPGKHRLRVAKDGFVVFGQEFEIESGGKQSIKAMLMPPKEGLAAPGNADLCRRAAEWVLSLGGKVTLWVDGKLTKEISDAARLPNQTFDIDDITFPFEGRTVIGDDDLIHLRGLLRLGRLTLPSPNITDESMKIVRELTNLHQLQLTSTKITNDGLALLSPLGNLSNLDVAATHVTGEGLVHIKVFPKLSYLAIGHLSINDQDLVHLYGAKSLKKVSVESTNVTAGGIASLQRALPKCEIIWNGAAETTPKSTTVAPAPPLAKAPFDAAQAKQHQQAWAKHLGVEVETPNSVGMKMVLIPPGEFMMGSTDEQVAAALKVAEEIKADSNVIGRIENAERPQHKVVITKPFFMSATEVTIGQFKKFSDTGYQTEAEKAAQDDPTTKTYLSGGSNELPAAYITWNDAVAYCQWLSIKEKTTYRLPTEAEWEYACRGGTTTQYSFGDDYNELSKYGWHQGNASNKSHPVGTLLPNPFGLLDIHGNLFEWCDDYYDEKQYSTSTSNDPSVGSYRVLRGGNLHSDASICRSAYRHSNRPSARYDNHGFRCVLEFSAVPTITANPPPPISTTLFMHDPAFPQWMAQVQAMPAEEQIKAVSKKLVEVNPGFNGSLTGFDRRTSPKIENNVVTEIGLLAVHVTDLSPIRALAGLKALECGGGVTKSTLSDLSPLQGMTIARLSCSDSEVSDLSPLQSLPLATLRCIHSKVTPASVAALQKALPNCKIEWDDPAKPTPQPATPSSPKLFMHAPAFPQWMAQVQAMPALEQIKAVAKKLMELNPGFDGKVTGFEERGTPKIENGVVTDLRFLSDNV